MEVMILLALWVPIAGVTLALCIGPEDEVEAGWGPASEKNSAKRFL